MNARQQEAWRPQRPARRPDDRYEVRERSNLIEQHPEWIARGLGWLSLALGVVEVAAPQRVAEWIGAPHDDKGYTALRVAGLRGLVSGLGILTHSDPTPWLKSRVAGDVIDLSLLGTAFNHPGADRQKLAMAAATVAGLSVIDFLTSQQFSRDYGEDVDSRPLPMGRRLQEAGIHVSESIEIERPPDVIYRFWRDFRNLPYVMHHLERVEMIDGQHSHWVAKAPAGMKVEWEAEIIADRPNELITWRSHEGSGIENAGAVHFYALPDGRGTEVRVELRYDPPAGAVGAALAKLFGEEPGQQIRKDLRRFKERMESSEPVQDEAALHARPL